jgi:uncharacterized protein (DUF1330 family)
MAAFIVGVPQLSDADPQLMGSYFGGIEGSLAPYGGRFRVAPDHRLAVLEGHWRPSEGVVVIEFPSFERAMAWYRSPEYAPLIAMRDAADAHADVILVDGLGKGETLFARGDTVPAAQTAAVRA